MISRGHLGQFLNVLLMISLSCLVTKLAAEGWYVDEGRVEELLNEGSAEDEWGVRDGDLLAGAGGGDGAKEADEGKAEKRLVPLSLSELRQLLLSSDMRQYGVPALSKDLQHGVMPGSVILQVVSVSNSAQPTTRQTASAECRLLTLRFTDGKNRVSGFEYKRVPALSLDTAPGTKLRLKDVRVMRGKLLLGPDTIEVLGGRVEALISNWATSRELARKYLAGIKKGEASEPPPAFESFTSQSNRVARVSTRPYASAEEGQISQPHVGAVRSGGSEATGGGARGGRGGHKGRGRGRREGGEGRGRHGGYATSRVVGGDAGLPPPELLPPLPPPPDRGPPPPAPAQFGEAPHGQRAQWRGKDRHRGRGQHLGRGGRDCSWEGRGGPRRSGRGRDRESGRESSRSEVSLGDFLTGL